MISFIFLSKFFFRNDKFAYVADKNMRKNWSYREYRRICGKGHFPINICYLQKLAKLWQTQISHAPSP